MTRPGISTRTGSNRRPSSSACSSGSDLHRHPSRSAHVNLPFIRTVALVLLAAAGAAEAQERRRGAYQLTLGPERGSATENNTTINSMGVDVRLQLAPAPFGSETFKIGAFVGIEGGYAKLSSRYYQGYADSTRMYTRWELGPALTWHRPD